MQPQKGRLGKRLLMLLLLDGLITYIFEDNNLTDNFTVYSWPEEI